MPKKTFFHLSKDKQETLIESAKKEFSRVPLHEASIANIIKSAGIPRGSFYQYFHDKEDLYYYLLNELAEKNNERFTAALKEKEGDLFEAFIDSFSFMMKAHRNPEYKNFFKNTFLNMNYKKENTLANSMYEESQKNEYSRIIQLINTTNLNIKDEQELRHILKIMTAVTFHNLVQSFVKELSDEESLQNYLLQIQLLKKGFQKEMN
ncbi:TetR/AcrR family transcriptional regulator [Domibacillus robiginosus]|uniref:TetR/AcrR family transcriptional regulator n=1 Tax=Domibacillus robiginosus TaxID=1071054 RepID=UPI00067E472D|nr:TetR family transcriptional regulator [Domibacillus robiginosus]